MQTDSTEAMRRDLQNIINAKRAERKDLERKYGKVWNTEELRNEFSVMGFAAPFVVVRRKSDGAVGSLSFQHSPRYYFDWEPYEKNM